MSPGQTGQANDLKTSIYYVPGGIQAASNLRAADSPAIIALMIGDGMTIAIHPSDVRRHARVTVSVGAGRQAG